MRKIQGALVLFEEARPILRRMQDAQYPDQLCLRPVENQEIWVATNGPESHTTFFLFTWIFQSHTLKGSVFKLEALPNDHRSDPCRCGWIMSCNKVFDLIKVLLGEGGEEDRQPFHRLRRRRTSFAAGIRGR